MVLLLLFLIWVTQILGRPCDSLKIMINTKISNRLRVFLSLKRLQIFLSHLWMFISLNTEVEFSKRSMWLWFQNEFNFDLNVFLFAFEIYLCKHCFVKKIGSGLFIMKIIHYIYWNHIFRNGNILREGMEDSTH